MEFRLRSPVTAQVWRSSSGEVSETLSPTVKCRVPQSDASDQGLMSGICDGDMQALGYLFQRYARLVRTVAVRILRDRSEADDLLQVVFLFIYRRCQVFDASKCSARSWIVQMTYQRAIDRRRYLQSRHFYTHVDLDGSTELVEPRSETVQNSECGLEMVGCATIEALLKTLTEDQRNALSLHFVDGYTFGEIAAKLDQSEGNIRNHFYRGLEKLRKLVFGPKLPGRNGNGR
jgi:RNA polymerase sigma-70 factor (ECF subfamily)